MHRITHYNPVRFRYTERTERRERVGALRKR